jgi:uncharacterized protein YdeI (YjbR/CyaY-like superfamily)
MKPKYFKSQGDFREWLETHHATAQELWIGYYKKDSGKRGMVYREALDEALCFGWIDGIVKRVDEYSYMQRWTPRRRASVWSNVNTRRFAELKKLGVVAPAGVKAFGGRDQKRSGIYLYERKEVPLAPQYVAAFKAKPGAWEFLQAQPPGYKRLAVGWIMHAKKEETRLKRLNAMIAASAGGRRTRWM